MPAPFQPLALLRRLRHARAFRSGCGLELPGWALTEVRFSLEQAAWLHDSLCSWHARRARPGGLPSAQSVSMLELSVSLAERQVRLRACRLADARALRRGDVAVLGRPAVQALLGSPGDTGGGLALVIEAGAQTLRLRAAGAGDAVTCRTEVLNGALLGWVLRSDPMLPALPVPAAHGAARPAWPVECALAA